jgi:hypothetical protein
VFAISLDAVWNDLESEVQKATPKGRAAGGS